MRAVQHFLPLATPLMDWYQNKYKLIEMTHVDTWCTIQKTKVKCVAFWSNRISWNLFGNIQYSSTMPTAMTRHKIWCSLSNLGKNLSKWSSIIQENTLCTLLNNYSWYNTVLTFIFGITTQLFQGNPVFPDKNTGCRQRQWNRAESCILVNIYTSYISSWYFHNPTEAVIKLGQNIPSYITIFSVPYHQTHIYSSSSMLYQCYTFAEVIAN